MSKLTKIFCAIIFATITSSCTLGPTVEHRTVYVTSGTMAIVDEEITVQVRVITDKGPVIMQQAIGGWVVMPKEHYLELTND